MNDPTIRFEELISALKERDFRLTPQRVELVREIATSKDHPSASQLYARLMNKFPTMSQATVYKTLTLLKELDQILEIDLQDDRHYDGNRPDPHPHLICLNCNKIMDGDLELDLSSIRKLEEISGYQVIRPQINLFGLCLACK